MPDSKCVMGVEGKVGCKLKSKVINSVAELSVVVSVAEQPAESKTKPVIAMHIQKEDKK